MPSPPGHISKEAIADARRAINDGNEDCVGLERIAEFRCEALTTAQWYRPEGGVCPYRAQFKNKDGRRLCRVYAELWAAETQGGQSRDAVLPLKK